jgi:hypothetical protein
MEFHVKCCPLKNVYSGFSSVYGKGRSWDSAVGIATGYELDGRGDGVRVPGREEFSLLHVVQTGSGAH